jgi:hypothetical protein
MSPSTLIEALIKSAPAFPKDTTLPIPLSKDSAYQLIRLCELQVYIKQGILGYVVLIPLVNGVFQHIQVDPYSGPTGPNQVYVYRHR